MDSLAILDFGGQYTHLIANRIRRLGVYSEILLPNTPAEDLKRFKGIIFSGGPHSVTEDGSPWIDNSTLSLGIPILGLCYGHQLISKALGGHVARGDSCEYGLARMSVVNESPMFRGINSTERIWMSHGDAVQVLPKGFVTIASTDDCVQTAVADEARKIYGFQFHPEVTDTPSGMTMLGNFLDICECQRTWSSEKFFEQIKGQILEQCGERKVFLLVSGGVDSTVAFALLNEVLGPERVYGLHVDTGMMRYNESAEIMTYMKEHGFNNLDVIDATDRFLSALDAKCEPEEKRDIIGRMFLEVKEEEELRLGLNADEWLLGQGTIYPDTIESAGSEHSDKIKTHHNRVDRVLELIEKGLIIEPLAQLYKDEVRELGESLGLPRKLVWRHPFPGPGLGVRLLCSDGSNELLDPGVSAGVNSISISEGFHATVLPLKSVGVQGDGRTYAHPALLCGTCDWGKLEETSTRITNNVPGVNRVLYGLNISSSTNYTLIKGFMTKDRLDKLREIDNLVTQVIFDSGEYEDIWQMPVVLLPMINTNGDECVVLRPIQSQEAMTARFCPLKPESIQKIIDGAECMEGIGDIFFDITHKPPGTIEWE